MNEREIFLAAIEISDQAERMAYLDRACAQDSKLRQRLDELLESHSISSQFMETPAAASESAIDQTLISGPDETEDDDSDPQGLSTVAQFRQYLEPSTRPGWLGRLGHYEIEEILGRGAFGIVAKAFDEKLHRVVAIKMMSPELASTSPPRKRFLREARTAAAVTHENIVAIYAVEEEPIPYLVMEYISGQTLQKRLDDQGPFDLADILRIGRQIASGLAAAQTTNMIHRDIKPANILLTGGVNERAKLSDFGLARAVDDASLTTSGLIAGTPMYMSPEQARGEPLDHRSDLFSLGSVLYQMASGRPPFRAANAIAVLKRVCEDQPRPLDDVIPETPAWLETIIFKLMEKDREQRYQTAQEVADLLEQCESELKLQGYVSCVPDASKLAPTAFLAPHPVPPDSGQRNKTKLWVGFGLAAIGIATAIYWNLPGPKAWPRGAWDAADHDRDGQVTRAEMELFGSQGSHRNVPRLLWHFESADTNHDGTVDHDEIDAYGYAVGSLDPNDHLPPPTVESSLVGATAGLPSSAKPGWHGWPADAPAPAIAPFDAEQARKHQEAWAAYLKVPVEYTNSIGMKFMLIPPGEFLMGSTPEEIEAALPIAGNDQTWQDCIRSEGPQHKVILTQPFYLGIGEVTQSQFQRIMETNPSRFSQGGEWADSVQVLDTANFPVETVEWEAAQEFCQQLVRREGLQPAATATNGVRFPFGTDPYRLPVEAEWEFACRGGSTTQFFSGETSADLTKVGWFDDNSLERTHQTGELPANGFGLHDMHGNVWEWVLDDWLSDSYTARAEQPTINPIGQRTKNSEHMSRGGNWVSYAEACRSASRSSASSAYDSSLIGFRVAMSVATVQDLVAKKRLDNSKLGAHIPSNFPADAPAPAIAPFDAEQAKKHQAEWAAYLKVPVEYTNSIGMKFRLIPPGEFLMGSTPEEIEAALKVAGEDEGWRERINSEGPQHKVVLTQPVYVGVTEVTQSQYEQVMGTNPSHFATSGDGKDAVVGLETGHHPVEMVSWIDATEFGAKLSQQEQLKPFYVRSGATISPLEGTGYRLPTEAEWEFACRAGTTSWFWSGNEVNDLTQVGWSGSNSGGRAHPAGELKANPFGLSDVHGNVSEWVQDSWEPTFYGTFKEDTAIDPSLPRFDGSQRVLRGGGWRFDPSVCRSSTRYAIQPTYRNFHLGFRVVLPVDTVKASLRNATPEPEPTSDIWPVDAPAPAIAPFDANQAKAHQEAWAKYLGMPVEKEVALADSAIMKFRLIPPGEFLMGSTDEMRLAVFSEAMTSNDRWGIEQLPSEGPQHFVRITKPFYLGQYEVTQSQWHSVMGKNDSLFQQNPDQPVEYVSWNAIQTFLTKLKETGIREGLEFVLPTEAQWEYACRAGTATDYSFGNDVAKLSEYGWFNGNSGGLPHPVGQLKPNGFGLFDMHGNAWEWCADSYADDYYAKAVKNDPTGPAASSLRVNRGGGWNGHFRNCRSARRNLDQPEGRHGNLGFRVSATLVKTPE